MLVPRGAELGPMLKRYLLDIKAIDGSEAKITCWAHMKWFLIFASRFLQNVKILLLAQEIRV